MSNRHCERSEAIHLVDGGKKELRIASVAALLAMTLIVQ